MLEQNFDGSSPVLVDTGFGHKELPSGGWVGISGSSSSNKGPYDFDDQLTVSADRGLAAEDYRPDLAGVAIGALNNVFHRNFPQGFWTHDPVDHYAVQFRVTLNGNNVCESGYMFNGNHYYGFHLTGCTPVAAGINKFDVEVRGMDMRETMTNRLGIGARDSNDNRGERFPYQVSIGADDTTPLPEYKKGGFSPSEIRDHYDNISVVPDYGFVTTRYGEELHGEISPIDKGIACDIHDRTLLVQFRKK